MAGHGRRTHLSERRDQPDGSPHLVESQSACSSAVVLFASRPCARESAHTSRRSVMLMSDVARCLVGLGGRCPSRHSRSMARLCRTGDENFSTVPIMFRTATDLSTFSERGPLLLPSGRRGAAARRAPGPGGGPGRRGRWRDALREVIPCVELFSLNRRRRDRVAYVLFSLRRTRS